MTSLGLSHENLFLQPGLRSEILLIRDWLDTGLPIDKPNVSIHSAAEALLIFLESLREPIVPYSMYSRCLECSGNYLQCKQVTSQLPAHHKHVFDYLTGNSLYIAQTGRHCTPICLFSIFTGSYPALGTERDRPKDFSNSLLLSLLKGPTRD